MKRYRSLALLVLTFAWFTACSGESTSAASPSDRQMEEIINNLLLRWTNRIITGDVIVTTGDNDWDKKEISSEEFKEVTAWAEVGLIKLTAEDVLSDAKQFSWKDWMDRTQSGQIKRIKVTPTEKGLEFQKESDLKEPPDPRFLYARFFTTTVEEIVESKEVKKDVDLYRVVKGSFRTQWNDVGKQVFSARGLPSLEQTKFIGLLKYDPFKKEWAWIASDSAPVDGNFHSNNVERYLARL